MTSNTGLVLTCVLAAATLLIPVLCFVLYRYGKRRTCLFFSHLWCMIAFFSIGMLFVITVRRHYADRPEYLDKTRVILGICQTLRNGDSEEGIQQLDDYLARALFRATYDIPSDGMKDQDPETLWVFQQVKEYYDTYQGGESVRDSMIPRIRHQLRHVPLSDMQVAIKKFEETYGSGEPAIAPPVNLKSWMGPPLTNEALKNKVILLDFWNTQCGPCIRAHPELQQIHETYEDRGLVVIACAGGDKKETKAYLDKHHYSFPAGMVSWQMHLDYAVRGNPTYFLIDRDGYLAWGPEHRLPTEEELAKLLAVE